MNIEKVFGYVIVATPFVSVGRHPRGVPIEEMFINGLFSPFPTGFVLQPPVSMGG